MSRLIVDAASRFLQYDAKSCSPSRLRAATIHGMHVECARMVKHIVAPQRIDSTRQVADPILVASLERCEPRVKVFRGERHCRNAHVYWQNSP